MKLLIPINSAYAQKLMNQLYDGGFRPTLADGSIEESKPTEKL